MSPVLVPKPKKGSRKGVLYRPPPGLIEEIDEAAQRPQGVMSGQVEACACLTLLLEMRGQLGRMHERLVQLEAWSRPEPTCLRYPDAAVRLGVGLTKMKLMVRRGEVRTVRVGKAPMIPASEIHRLATLELPPLSATKRLRLAQT
jgi:hypothetical protein